MTGCSRSGADTESRRRSFASASKKAISARVNHSAKMIQAATRRNGAYLQAGRAEFLVASLEDLDLGDRRFDRIFAVRVGLFHRDPGRAHGIVERWLAPGGAVFVFINPPSGPTASPPLISIGEPDKQEESR